MSTLRSLKRSMSSKGRVRKREGKRKEATERAREGDEREERQTKLFFSPSFIRI
jgi:hypothetical protein